VLRKVIHYVRQAEGAGAQRHMFHVTAVASSGGKAAATIVGVGDALRNPSVRWDWEVEHGGTGAALRAAERHLDSLYPAADGWQKEYGD
jgi:hypothetical protein